MKLFQCMASFVFGKNISRHYHVCIIGAASEIGQTVGLLLRLQKYVSKLTIYDTNKETPGVLLDLSHIPSVSKLQGFTGENSFDKAVQDADVVVVAGGCTRRPGTSKKNWLDANINFIKKFATGISKMSPMPFIGIATEPINTLVPIVSEIMRNNSHYEPKKLFGITCIDVLKAQYVYAKEHSLPNPSDCSIPVIGGHSKRTIVPLLSQRKPMNTMNEKQIYEFTNDVRSYDESILVAKKGWSPSLSVAYGIMIFTRQILEGLDGRKSQVHAFVENNDFGTSFFSGLVNVDKDGTGKMQRYWDLSKYETLILEQCIEELKKDVLRGKKALELA